MDRLIPKNDLKTRLLRLVRSDTTNAGSSVAGSQGHDRVIAR